MARGGAAEGRPPGLPRASRWYRHAPWCWGPMGTFRVDLRVYESVGPELGERVAVAAMGTAWRPVAVRRPAQMRLW